MKTGIRKIIEGLVILGLSGTEMKIEEEAGRLHALIDGLALHAVMKPDQFNEEKMKAILRNHLLSLLEK
jgi:BetI-type transcriptional repressor, C-terminal